MAAKYVAYRSGPKERDWLLIEEDGSEDGRTVAEGLTIADATHLTAVLNAHEEALRKKAPKAYGGIVVRKISTNF